MQAVQLKMARAALGLSADDLATRAGIDKAAVAALERGDTPQGSALQALSLFLSAQGIELIDSDGVRAKQQTSHDFVTVDHLTTDNDGGEG